ncbi:MAG: antitoxin [Acidimicrobiales bacterium]
MFDKIKAAAEEHGDKVVDGVDKATDAVDDKTGGKYTDHLEKVDEMAEKHLGTDTPE